MAQVMRRGASAAVMKALGLFSGVQCVTIVCSLIRVKLVAIWLGPIGVGLFGIFNQALETISSLTQLGIRNSAVRDVAAHEDSPERLSRIAIVVSRWAWTLGVAGAVITILLSPALSSLTFGDHGHTAGFILLAAAVLFASAANAPLAILQGIRQLKRLAKASVYGSIAGLALSVPLYRWIGLDSVVPSLVIYSVSLWFFAWLFRAKINKCVAKPTIRETIDEGVPFVRLGIFMTVSVFFTMVSNYVFLAWLNSDADTADVGYYQAGYTMINRYIGLIFTAIVMEYYPRLTKTISSKRRTSVFATHEMTIGLSVIVPVALWFMTFDDVAIKILYDSQFVSAAGYIDWALAGTVLRAVSWCMAIVILARADGKIYLITEALSAVMFVALSIPGWKLGGLDGLGMAYFAWYAAYTVIVGVVYFRAYRLKVSASAALLTAAGTAAVTGGAILRHYEIRWGVALLAVAATAVCATVLLRLLTNVSKRRRLP